MNKLKMLGAAIILSMTMMVYPAQQNSSAEEAKPAPAPVATSAAKEQTVMNVNERIAHLVHLHQPQKGWKYANHVADTIVDAAYKYKIGPMYVAGVALIESGFYMHSRPCIGIMQISPGTARHYRRAYKLNAHDLEDNIHIGAHYLSNGYYKALGVTPAYRSGANLASRSGSGRISRSRRHQAMNKSLGSYNGSGTNGFYVARFNKLLPRLEQDDPKTWAKTIKSKGALWK